jgi:hypothetical protein
VARKKRNITPDLRERAVKAFGSLYARCTPEQQREIHALASEYQSRPNELLDRVLTKLQSFLLPPPRRRGRPKGQNLRQWRATAEECLKYCLAHPTASNRKICEAVGKQKRFIWARIGHRHRDDGYEEVYQAQIPVEQNGEQKGEQEGFVGARMGHSELDGVCWEHEPLGEHKPFDVSADAIERRLGVSPRALMMAFKKSNRYRIGLEAERDPERPRDFDAMAAFGVPSFVDDIVRRLKAGEQLDSIIPDRDDPRLRALQKARDLIDDFRWERILGASAIEADLELAERRVVKWRGKKKRAEIGSITMARYHARKLLKDSDSF